MLLDIKNSNSKQNRKSKFFLIDMHFYASVQYTGI